MGCLVSVGTWRVWGQVCPAVGQRSPVPHRPQVFGEDPQTAGLSASTLNCLHVLGKKGQYSCGGCTHVHLCVLCLCVCVCVGMHMCGGCICLVCAYAHVCASVCVCVCVCVMLVCVCYACVCVLCLCVCFYGCMCVCFTLVWVSLWFSVCVCVSSCKCGITLRMFEERQYCRCLLFWQVETLESVKRAVSTEYYTSFDECVAWARNLFQANYNNQIKQLLFNFPPDQVSSVASCGVELPSFFCQNSCFH